MEDEKWFTIPLYPDDTGYKHRLYIFNGSLRNHPLILICEPDSVIFQTDIYDNFTAVPLEKDCKLNYKYFKYKISQEDLIHYKKFVEYNRDALRNIYYDKSHSYCDDDPLEVLTFI